MQPDELPKPEPPNLITLPFKEFLQHLWQNSTSDNTFTRYTSVSPALAVILRLKDMSETHYHVEGNTSTDKELFVYPIDEWKSSWSKRVARDKQRVEDNAVRLRSHEIKQALVTGIMSHDLFKGLFTKPQAEIIATQVLLKRDWDRAKQFGVTDIKDDERILL